MENRWMDFFFFHVTHSNFTFTFQVTESLLFPVHHENKRLWMPVVYSCTRAAQWDIRWWRFKKKRSGSELRLKSTFFFLSLSLLWAEAQLCSHARVTLTHTHTTRLSLSFLTRRPDVFCVKYDGWASLTLRHLGRFRRWHLVSCVIPLRHPSLDATLNFLRALFRRGL